MTQSDSIDDARRRRIAGAVALRLEPGNGGLPRLVVGTAAAEAELYLHGAHVTAWRPGGEGAVIFTSGKSFFRPDKAIRGGVPICFPWFGLRAGLPQHGFARTREWKLDSTAETAEGVQIDLSLRSDEQTRTVWPHEFLARYRVTIGSALRLRLEASNPGREAFAFEDALHSYFCVGDARRISVSGLANTEYLDKTADGAKRTQTDPLVHISGEVDRLYFNTTADCVIDDPGGARRIRLAKTGSNATVVWNPHAEKAKALADFGDDDWMKMVCVETANAGPSAIELAGGATHVTEAIVTVER